MRTLAPRKGAPYLACVAMLFSAACSDHVLDVGFWFEPIAFESEKLDPPLTPDEHERIAAMAATQVAEAFEGLAIRITDRRDTRYSVRVVGDLRGGAGESRTFGRYSGAGEVSFPFLAIGALHHAPSDASRADVVEAIARGIARTAVHELTHQLLPTTPIHDSTNVRSYEFASAARREQYFGPIEWDLAWPHLERRLGVIERPGRTDPGS